MFHAQVRFSFKGPYVDRIITKLMVLAFQLEENWELN